MSMRISNFGQASPNRSSALFEKHGAVPRFKTTTDRWTGVPRHRGRLQLSTVESSKARS